MRVHYSAIKGLLAVAVFAFATFAANDARAQTSATVLGVSGSAVIAATMSIAKTSDLDFGIIAAPAGASTMVLSTAGARTGGGGAVAVSGGTVTNAVFTIGGSANATYGVTFTPDPAVLSGPGVDMTVDTWTWLSATSGNATLTLSGAGADTMTIGGTLQIGAGQTAGAYTGTFDVTVDYN